MFVLRLAWFLILGCVWVAAGAHVRPMHEFPRISGESLLLKGGLGGCKKEFVISRCLGSEEMTTSQGAIYKAAPQYSKFVC